MRTSFPTTGEYYSYDDVTLVPKAYQQPYPPTRIAVASEDTFSLVGKLGHPIFISATTAVPLLQERLELYRQAWEESGHSGPIQVSLRIPAYVAEDNGRAASDPEGEYQARDTVWGG